MLMLFQGRIAGVSGIAVRLLHEDGERGGRLAFILGLVVAPIVYMLATGDTAAQVIEARAGVLVVAGLLVGFGSVWGNGCTSGHGVCGLSRLSLRSLVATLVFIGLAIVTVYVSRHWL
ncbi:MAG: YeeE/YedE family protein [Betaproteobacteria bacterium]|nr:YeeE/YedE family protein [Betaproteobacteria bacterium]